MNSNLGKGLSTSLLFGILFSLVVLGSCGLAAFAIHEGFQGKLGLKVRDWIQIDFQGLSDSKASQLSPSVDQVSKEEAEP